MAWCPLLVPQVLLFNVLLLLLSVFITMAFWLGILLSLQVRAGLHPQCYCIKPLLDCEESIMQLMLR